MRSIEPMVRRQIVPAIARHRYRRHRSHLETVKDGNSNGRQLTHTREGPDHGGTCLLKAVTEGKTNTAPASRRPRHGYFRKSLCHRPLGISTDEGGHRGRPGSTAVRLLQYPVLR